MSIGGALLRALQAGGNVLDLPGSSVRDALALRNPFDQWLSPFSSEDRTTGSELLGGRGGPVGGFLAEMVLDPTNWAGGIGLIGKGAKAFKAGRAATKARSANAAAQIVNLSRDRALSKLKAIEEIEATTMARRGLVPDKTINVMDIPEHLPKVYPGLSDSQLRTIHRGPADWAAKEIVEAQPEFGRLTAPTESMELLARREAFRPYGYTGGTSEKGRTLGFIPADRPELVFGQVYTPLPTRLGTDVHEATHSLQGQFPEVGREMKRAIGDDAMEIERMRRYGQTAGGPIGNAFSRALPELIQEMRSPFSEPVAQITGKAVQRGALRQRYPIQDYLMTGRGREQTIESFAQELRRATPKAGKPLNPRKVAERFLDFVEGRLQRARSLTPSGPLTDVPYGPAPIMTSAERAAVLAPYSKVGSVPRREPYPSQLALALLAHNALARNRGQNQ